MMASTLCCSISEATSSWSPTSPTTGSMGRGSAETKPVDRLVEHQHLLAGIDEIVHRMSCRCSLRPP